MKQEKEEYIEEDTEGGGEEGEEGGIWIEGKEREERRMKEEGKGKKENEKEELIEIKLLNVQGLTEDKWIEILEETGDDSIMCLTETQKR